MYVRVCFIYFFFMQQSNAMGDKYSFHLSCLFLLASLLTPYIPTYYSTYPYVNDRLSFYERQEFPFFITDEMARCGASLPWWTSPPVSTVNCTFLFLDLMRCRGFTPFYKEWRVLYNPPPPPFLMRDNAWIWFALDLKKKSFAK